MERIIGLKCEIGSEKGIEPLACQLYLPGGRDLSAKLGNVLGGLPNTGPLPVNIAGAITVK